jgi:hypothetical protein
MNLFGRSTPKVAVYTAMYGTGLDTIKTQPTSNLFDLYCFTDILDLDTKNFTKIFYPALSTDTIRSAKVFKLFPELFLHQKYDFAIWIDTTIVLNTDTVNEMITKYVNVLKKYPVYFLQHPERDCVYDEIDFCISLKKDNPELLQQIKQRYEFENYPRKNGLYACTVVGWQNNRSLIEFQTKWMEEINNFSFRDQISLPYVMQKKKINFFLDKSLNVFHNKYWQFDYSQRKPIHQEVHK